MEPLSAAVSVLGIIVFAAQGVLAFISTLEAIREAEERVQAVLSQLRILKSLLEDAEALSNSGSDRNKEAMVTLHDALEPHVRRAESILERSGLADGTVFNVGTDLVTDLQNLYFETNMIDHSIDDEDHTAELISLAFEMACIEQSATYHRGGAIVWDKTDFDERLVSTETEVEDDADISSTRAEDTDLEAGSEDEDGESAVFNDGSDGSEAFIFNESTDGNESAGGSESGRNHHHDSDDDSSYYSTYSHRSKRTGSRRASSMSSDRRVSVSSEEGERSSQDGMSQDGIRGSENW
ncbi:hypothetical protein B0T14DRAFT_567286 [Immersiella caudata]|uniref:Fungal N-terminal domain-containing protein n=1 Tax=Immersiella caudata TaxID=314043 RepID=A0AA40C0X8_9PEZI|nr:hypothetical protein B0T14DRAFT_567286 [Immersiella caudata]